MPDSLDTSQAISEGGEEMRNRDESFTDREFVEDRSKLEIARTLERVTKKRSDGGKNWLKKMRNRGRRRFIVENEGQWLSDGSQESIRENGKWGSFIIENGRQWTRDGSSCWQSIEVLGRQEEERTGKTRSKKTRNRTRKYRDKERDP